MKYLRLFEAFVLEASNTKKIKGIQKQIQEINDEMESIQDAIDSGDMDADEGEIQLSDLDANKLELEEELSDLNAEDSAAKAEVVRKLVAKVYDAVRMKSYQSVKWSTMLEWTPKSEKAELKFLTSLKKRDEEIEKEELEDIEEQYAKIEALKGDMSAEVSALLSFVKTDLFPAKDDRDRTSYIVQAFRELCQKYNTGCDQEEPSLKENRKASAKLDKVKSTLTKLGRAANIRVN